MADQTTSIVKPFRVELYDAFDRKWIEIGSNHHFSSKEEALADRDKLNQKLKANSPDHYGVIHVTSETPEVTRGREIDCPKGH